MIKSGFTLADETKYTWVTKGVSTLCQRPTPKCTFMVLPSDGKVILTKFIYMYILETFYCGIKNNAGAFVIGNVQWRSQPDF